jgi:integrase/PHD/YefM family antitoxin component YafN of YafNO toxin-antitoxin module
MNLTSLPRWSVSKTTLGQELDQVVAKVDAGPVAVLEGWSPVAYVVSPEQWQRLLALEGMAPTAASSTAEAVARVSLSPYSMAMLSGRLAEQEAARARRGEVADASVQVLRNRLKAHVLPALGDMDVRKIRPRTLEDFLTRLQAAELSNVTISQYMVIVRKAMKLAVKLGWIDRLPEFPAVKTPAKPRAMITVMEYRRLVQAARRLQSSGVQAPCINAEGELVTARFWVPEADRLMQADLAAAMRFMVNAFVRPTDVKVLRHKHIEVVRGAKTYLRLNLPETKKHVGAVVTMPAAVRVYEAMLRRARAMGVGEPDDFVFLPHHHDRNYALSLLGFWFKWALREAEVAEVDATGGKRTLYSLRHSAIMYRLMYGQGIDMLTLARNARTSVPMIERHYASALTGEMNIDLLHSRRRR